MRKRFQKDFSGSAYSPSGFILIESMYLCKFIECEYSGDYLCEFVDLSFAENTGQRLDTAKFPGFLVI